MRWTISLALLPGLLAGCSDRGPDEEPRAAHPLSLTADLTAPHKGKKTLANLVAVQQAVLNEGAGTDFGKAISIHDDTTIVSQQKRSRIFSRNGTTWSEQASFPVGEGFVSSVSVFGDTGVVGAFPSAYYWNGFAHVFVREGTAWSQQAELLPSDGEDDAFGVSVAVWSDTVVVGSPKDDDLGDGSGAAYVFVRQG